MVEPSAVLFDVGNTVLHEHRFDLEAGILAAIPHLGERVPGLALLFTDQLQEHHVAGRELLLSRWLMANVPELAGRAVDDVEDAMWAAVVTLTPTPGIEAVLGHLRESGTGMAAVSNASFSARVLARELSRHGLGGLFRFVLSSGDVGWRKPVPAIFDEAVSRLGTPAERTWFVGDSFDEDIRGAFDAGLTPIWFSSGDTSIATEPPVCRVRDWGEFIPIYHQARATKGVP